MIWGSQHVHNRESPCTIPIFVGAPPTDVRAEQNSPDTVLVTWTPPPAPPAAGYQVQVTVGTTTATSGAIFGTSYITSVSSQYGIYTIRVISHSQHLPGQASAPFEVTLRGKLRPLFVNFKFLD